ncbi:MAG: AMP-binding protein [Deltaproteobacteria bacterium]|nr:AMP-binding protein [Deltaproteobacteria bacterium]
MDEQNYSRTEDIVNVSYFLKENSNKFPYKRAVVFPEGRDGNGRVAYTHLTFRQLDRESDRIAAGLEKAGITRGTRTILMVRQSIDFFALTFALFKAGAVPVVVDPGMGIKRMLNCMSEGRPEAFIGIPLAHVLRTVYPKFFSTVNTFVTVGKKYFWSGLTLKQIRETAPLVHKTAETVRNETAAILFTSGSTGPAKGVVYTHGTFDAQIRQIRSHFEIGQDEIDLPTFPLFALFDPALCMTAIIPDMDPTKPALVNPEKIIEAIINHGVTNMFASPALLNRVGRYGKEKGLRLPSLKRVVSAGAPVLPSNIEQFSSILTKDAEIHTPYGATEAVPIVSISSHEILSETKELSEKGFGTCVGRPINDTEIRLIKINDEPIENWSEDLMVPENEIGEIIVKSPVVSRCYFEKPKYDAIHKIIDGYGFWHRMGDLGWKDNKGRVWFCGRKTHRVTTQNGVLYTIPCEAIFNAHPAVFRSALVGIGKPANQKPIICIEIEPSQKPNKKTLGKELLALGTQNIITKDIKKILFHKSFPVDIRHNSKIFREKLAIWAEKKLDKR